ncbi:hypothetical protein BGZ65_006815 [Modicella reniformis]|uniref:Uncharacterized protein n=1 Tax=Modicella reniformis TaxID=1440133 RepID=A0A9P6SVG8_9FUNG|nr:hypothetical protein BGZ65_006815 [Modicella reniformis]
MTTTRGRATRAKTVAASSNAIPTPTTRTTSWRAKRSTQKDPERSTRDVIPQITRTQDSHETDPPTELRRFNTRSAQTTRGPTKDVPTRRGKIAQPPGLARNLDCMDVDDIKTPRRKRERERVEAVVIPVRTNRWKKAVSESASKVIATSHSTNAIETAAAITMTMASTAMTTDAVEVSEIRVVSPSETQRLKELGWSESKSFTDLAHTDYSANDHYDGLLSEPESLKQNEDEEDVEDEDDPFGFFKAERRLQRTKDRRPKLLAINEVNNFLTTTYSSKSSTNTIDSSISNSNNSGGISSSVNMNLESGSTLRERLDRNVLERAASRRRGDVKGKGKATDQGCPSSSSDRDKSKNYTTDTTTDFVDKDLQKAIRLSRNLNVDNGEGSSTFWKPATELPSSGSDPTNGTAADNGLNLLTDREPVELDDTTLLTGSVRQISRLYGQAMVDEDTSAVPDSTTGVQVTPLTMMNSAAETHVQNSVEEVGGSNDDKAFRPISPSTPPREVVSSSRLSIVSDDFSPIVFETTPKKKPEAGMPLSMEFSPKGPKKYLLTEQLEAMLPQRRRREKRTKIGKSWSQHDVMMIESEDDRIMCGPDYEYLSSDQEGEQEQEQEQEKNVAAARSRRHVIANQLSSSTRETSNLSKKRRAPSEPATFKASKRSHVQQSSDPSGNKRKSKVDRVEDKSGWSASQQAAHEKRIKYFRLVDDFELEVETV